MRNGTMLAMGASVAAVAALVAGTAESEKLDSLNAALRDGGAIGLLSTAVAQGWTAPQIPSKWYVEARLRDEGKIKAANAARDFGLALAVRLETVAQRFQDLPPDGELCDLAHRLLDLADWCASTDGVGNLLLGQRCMDIAAVGLGRVTANTGFPLGECGRLASRMSPPPEWAEMELRRRCRVLDAEAGTNLFAVCRAPDDMRRVWMAGIRLKKREDILRLKAEVTTDSDRLFVERLLQKDDIVPEPVLLAAADFFEDDPPLFDPGVTPETCRTRWDMRNHRLLLNDLRPQSIQKALALLRFREEVGHFPERPQLTQEETRAIIEAARRGGREIMNPENDPYSDPQREAFSRAWRASPNRQKKDNNLYSPAFQAYWEITSGTFYDNDTFNVKGMENSKRLQEELEQRTKTPQ